MLEVDRLLQEELGWLAFINELGFGVPRPCGSPESALNQCAQVWPPRAPRCAQRDIEL